MYGGTSYGQVPYGAGTSGAHSDLTASDSWTIADGVFLGPVGFESWDMGDQARVSGHGVQTNDSWTLSDGATSLPGKSVFDGFSVDDAVGATMHRNVQTTGDSWTAGDVVRFSQARIVDLPATLALEAQPHALVLSAAGRLTLEGPSTLELKSDANTQTLKPEPRGLTLKDETEELSTDG